MRISVYVPCHNNEKTLAAVLDSVRNQTRPADELLFVNDRCTDRSPAIAASMGCKILSVNGDSGLAAARNRALECARGDLLLGVDADVILEPGFLAEVERQFECHPEVAAMCGYLREQFTETPADLWRSVHMAQHFGPEELIDPRFVYGATTAVRRTAVRSLGGWNPRFRTNYEDVDLSERLMKAGHRLLYAPEARAQHLRRDSVRSVLHGYWKWNFHPGDIHGSFDSLRSWLNSGLSYDWSLYRRFRVQDGHSPALSSITLLLPWTQVLYDLHALRERKGIPIGSLQDVVNLAYALLTRSGASWQLVNWAAEELGQIVADLASPSGEDRPMDHVLLAHIEQQALESIPDINYWPRLRTVDSQV